MTDVKEIYRGQAARSNNARETVARRFEEAAGLPPEHTEEEVVAFPGYLRPSSVRYRDDGGLSLSISVPAEFSHDLAPQLVSMADKTLVLTVAVIYDNPLL